LNDRHERQLAASACGEQRQNVKGRHRAEFVTVKYHAFFQLSFVSVRNGKQLTRQVLDHEPRHEVFRRIFLRDDQKNRTLLSGKVLRIDRAVIAEHLLLLGIDERIQAGKHRGHDGGHALFGGTGCCGRHPACLMCIRQAVYQNLKSIFLAHGSHQFLHQLEHRHDVPLVMPRAVRWNELRQRHDHGCQHTLRCVIEVRVLPAILLVATRIDNGLGQDLCVLFRRSPRLQVVRMFPRKVHVAVDQRHQIVSIRADRVAQVDH